MPRQERRRAKSALVTIVFSIFILVAPLVAMAMAQSEPKIAFLNPSDYSAGVSEAPLQVSDRTTGSDEEDSVNEDTYRLSAYTANTPATAVVEFEIDIISDLGNLFTENIGTADRVANDAFEFHWDSESVPDGEYTLRAILYSASGIGGTEIARTEQVVIVNNTNASAAADIVFPANGAQTGFYVNPLNGSTNTLMTIEYSAGVSSVRIFYTVSAPGEPPVWKPCSAANFVGGDQLTQAGGQARMRCVLASIDQGGASVTGLGVVSNNSQRRSYNQNLNQAGDGIRVLPYKQDAASVTVDAETVRANGNLSGEEVCSPDQTVTVIDQLGHQIGGISVDVHAQGPNDQVRFNTGGFFLGGPSYGNSAPDQGHTGTETAYECFEVPPNAAPGTQGDHNVAGGDDIKHVEGSTENAGDWGWNLRSVANGTTQLTAWVDEDDDDRFCDDEPSVVASIGWNEPAPAPAGETPIVFDCPIPTPPPPSDGTDSPSPSETNGGTDCTIEGTDGDDVIRGTDGNDIICAGAGDDDIQGYGGDDIIRAESGNDIVQGDEGDDTLDGGTGNDRLEGGFDNDLLDGTGGTDVLLGGAGNDTLRGQASLDGMQGGSGKDVIQGGGGDDVADGQSGADILKGYNGEDILRGGGGGDTIKGMNMNDQLTGGGGNDKISGGSGRDQCSGGSGRDRLRQCER